MKKILVVQLRSKEYAKHERVCFERNFRKYYDDMHFVNIYYKDKLPKTISDLEKYSCVIIAGTGEYSLSINDKHGGGKTPFVLIQFMKLIVKHDFPFLGLCYGHQLLGHVLGTDVISDDNQKEIGSFLIQLTKEAKIDMLWSKLDSSFYAEEGHNDCLVETPKGCTLLASSERYKVQALKYKENIYSVQFHAEMTPKESKERVDLYLKLNPNAGYDPSGVEYKNDSNPQELVDAFLNKYHNSKQTLINISRHK